MPEEDPTPESPRSWRFNLNRIKDSTGISGTGTIATGVLFEDGEVVLKWLTMTPTTVIFKYIDDVVAVHGHGGDTQIVWVDNPDA